MAAKRVIQVQKSPEAGRRRISAMELLAELCYLYSYPIGYARRLPYRKVILLLREGRRLKAKEYYNLTHIAAAPHSEKGKNVELLLDHYKEHIGGE